MKSTSIISLLAIFALTHRLSAADASPEWKVQVAGVRVVAPAPEGKDDLRAFNSSPGVTVVLLVTTTKGKIVSVDARASKLETFTDDKGANLLAAHAEDFYSRAGFSSWSSVSDKDDATSKRVEVNAPGLPTKGATQLSFSGKLVVQTASQSTQFTADGVELKKGTKLKIGDIPLTVSDVLLSGEITVSLEAKQDLSSIAEVEFFDDQGNKIESRMTGSSGWNSGTEMTVKWNFALRKNVAKAKIVASSWTDLKTTEIPIAIKTGVGL